ncbi:pentatricopeptide repeat-containing protein At4g02750-like [Selaginella moellendorffii]|uniref:pentatricopeptide repeat-containing protein At4g02750-like n=1 Tax=Selaginella moellendorffii TaxID=88036 RepID=UPI000D1CDDAE|nr:pentatricopeptide repeat-containing protein At4g02750-like [Selaginella moellendorffii]|eukprot:XP_024539370.1 pentatricopeptide repeat-containing protein At4g02750-like [Selaginella moellendorffii]
MRLLFRRSRGARKRSPRATPDAPPDPPSQSIGLDEEDRLGFLLRSCQSPRDLPRGQELEREISASDSHRHSTYLANLLIQMYAKCGRVDQARRIFDGIAAKNSFSHNLMLRAYAQSNHIEEMERVFANIGNGNSVGWNTMIAAYARTGHLDLARTLFDRMENRDSVTWNAIVTGYARHGRLTEAKRLFDEMIVPGVVAYTAMIQAYAQAGHLRGAKKLFDSMPLGRNSMAWVTMLQGFVECGEMADAWSLFLKIPQRGVVAESIAIAAAVAGGDLDRAKHVFLAMPERNLVAWTTMLGGFAQGLSLRGAKRLFDQMPAWGVASFNTLLVAMAQSGRIEQSLVLFSGFPERDLVSWTAMVAAYAHSGYGQRALELFRAMVAEGHHPDAIAFVSVLNACSHIGIVEEGVRCFTAMVADFGIAPWRDHFSATVDLFSRAGQLQNARDLIETMPFLPDSIAWGALLAGARTHRRLEFAELAAARVAELDPERSAAPLVALAGMYSAAGRASDAARIRDVIRERGLSKLAGLSCVEIGRSLHRFAASDSSHPRNEEIRAELERIHELMREEGYAADAEVASEALKLHSERMAVALALIEEPCSRDTIRVMKNLRVCCDCHTALKLMAKISQRRIVKAPISLTQAKLQALYISIPLRLLASPTKKPMKPITFGSSLLHSKTLLWSGISKPSILHQPVHSGTCFDQPFSDSYSKLVRNLTTLDCCQMKVYNVLSSGFSD